MPNLAFVNTDFLPLAEATIPVEDRGFQFGDGAYEVVRTYGGRPFELDAHLDRLRVSAQALRIALPKEARELARIVKEGIQRAAFSETKVYIQLTRGVAARDHAFPADTRPTLVMTFREFRTLDPAIRAKGVSVITMEDPRWSRCDIKSLNLLGNVLARQRAMEAGAFETLFVRDAIVTEGAVSNVMAVRGGVLHTASTGPAILSGVTRRCVLELAQKDGLPVREEGVTLDQLYAAEEVFLTGTTIEVLPVVRVNDVSIASGAPGPISSRLARRFEEASRT